MTTFNTIKSIMAELNDKIFAEMDAKVLEESKIWAQGRCAAIKEFKDSSEFRNEQGRITDQYKYYARLFAIAGGKTWYNALEPSITIASKLSSSRIARRLPKSATR